MGSVRKIINKLRWKIGIKIYQHNHRMGNFILGIRLYKPKSIEKPKHLINVQSTAWMGLEKIIGDIIQTCGIENSKCLEFGVEFGYSTVVFSNYFKTVIGVDLFTGDMHAGFNGDIYPMVSSRLSQFSNIELIQSSFEDYIFENNDKYNLIHVDIIHTYEATFKCGIWAANHSDCTLFHDTESFPEVKRAIIEIASITGKTFYNYPSCNGLGILV